MEVTNVTTTEPPGRVEEICETITEAEGGGVSAWDVCEVWELEETEGGGGGGGVLPLSVGHVAKRVEVGSLKVTGTENTTWDGMVVTSSSTRKNEDQYCCSHEVRPHSDEGTRWDEDRAHHHIGLTTHSAVALPVLGTRPGMEDGSASSPFQFLRTIRTLACILAGRASRNLAHLLQRSTSLSTRPSCHTPRLHQSGMRMRS